MLSVRRPADPSRVARRLLEPADLGLASLARSDHRGALQVPGVVGVARRGEERREAPAVRRPVERDDVHSGSGDGGRLPAREVDHVDRVGLPLPLPADGAAAGPLRLALRLGERKGGEEGEPLAVGREGEPVRFERAGVEHPGLAAGEGEEVDAGLAVLLAEEGQGGTIRRPDRTRGGIGREGELTGLTARGGDHPELGGHRPAGLEIAHGGARRIEVGRGLRGGVEVLGLHRVGDASAVGREGDAARLGQGDQLERGRAGPGGLLRRARGRGGGRGHGGREEEAGEGEGSGRGAQVHGRAS